MAIMLSTNVNPFTIAKLEHLITTHGEVLHGFRPYPWQNQAVQHLLQMNAMSYTEPTSPVMVVRSTGGGKSAVRDVTGCIMKGVVLTIVPLLSLGADQTKKLEAYVRNMETASNRRHFCVKYLDKITNKSAIESLQQQLLNLRFLVTRKPVHPNELFSCSPRPKKSRIKTQAGP